jgi:hypothetical protein
MSTPQTKTETPPLTVACKKCGGQAGRIEDGQLVYTVKHSGEHHTIRIDLRWLEKVLSATRENVLT